MSVDHRLEGRIGRVTGRVAAGTVGEVRIPIRGGIEFFHAYPCDDTDEFVIGEEVYVVEACGPRSVKVMRSITPSLPA